MFKLPIKKCFFLAKICVLFMLVVTILSLFEHWRGGKRVARAQYVDPLEEEYERQILEDEARIVPGLGDDGAPAFLSGEERRLGEESEKKYAMNTYLSDRISYNRTLKDFRNPACPRIVYDAELPSASVVIIFHNEPYSVVLRTVWSVLNTARRDQPWYKKANFVERETGRTMEIGYPGQEPDSEFVYLKEIILVDDNSTLPELRGKLSHYVRTRLPRGLVRLLRLPDRGGLIRARVSGARVAQGAVLVFLDGHCEGLEDWIRPLLQRIKDKRTAVLTPVIDMIDGTTFRYDTGEVINFEVGGFTFVGHFTWIDVPERERKRRGSEISPTWSPTMAGGLFAMSRSYYWELGAYDEQMAGWGGENLEMSFRIWQCGGTLETIPCSRVGHVFRAFHPYGLPADSDTHGINTARMAEVWMDEYAELFYLHRPDLRKNPIIGDVTHRKILREKLHCKSFQWFLDNVYKEKFVPVRDVLAYGRVRNAQTGLCLDTMQREGDGSALGFYPCHSTLSATQYLSLSLTGQLRDEEKCAEMQYVRHLTEESDEDRPLRVLMVTCANSGQQRGQQWKYVRSSQQLRHAASGLCLDARGAAAGDDVRARACGPHAAQRWTFDYGDSVDSTDSSKLLPPDMEERLQKLKGLRRRSRSLLAEAPRQRRRRRPRGKRRGRKKGRKNKFVLIVERTLMNNSVEHLELDVHCAHQRLMPNNTFVRDLVTILNEKNIRVINNGRVFERNRVTELGKEDPLTLRQEETKVLEKMALQPETLVPPMTMSHPPDPMNMPEPKRAKFHKKVRRRTTAPAAAGGAPGAKRIIVEDFVEVTASPPPAQLTIQPQPHAHSKKRKHKKKSTVFPHAGGMSAPGGSRAAGGAGQGQGQEQDQGQDQVKGRGQALVRDQGQDQGQGKGRGQEQVRGQGLGQGRGSARSSSEDAAPSKRQGDAVDEAFGNALDDSGSDDNYWSAGLGATTRPSGVMLRSRGGSDSDDISWAAKLGEGTRVLRPPDALPYSGNKEEGAATARAAAAGSDSDDVSWSTKIGVQTARPGSRAGASGSETDDMSWTKIGPTKNFNGSSQPRGVRVSDPDAERSAERSHYARARDLLPALRGIAWKDKEDKDKVKVQKRFPDVEVVDNQKQGEEPGPVKLVMRSNLTFNLGDELFAWRKQPELVNLLEEEMAPQARARALETGTASDESSASDSSGSAQLPDLRA